MPKKNTITAFYLGEPMKKKVDGKKQLIRCFAGVTEGECGEMGIGFQTGTMKDGAFVPKTLCWWALMTPHALLQTWRAAQLLEQVSRIESGTLSYCVEVMRRNPLHGHSETMAKLTPLFGNRHRLDLARHELLASVPTNLDGMITRVRINRAEISVWEFEHELEARVIERTSVIDYLIEEHKVWLANLKAEQQMPTIELSVRVGERLSKPKRKWRWFGWLSSRRAAA